MGSKSSKRMEESKMKKYDLIVVDPPWPIKKLARRVRPKQVMMDYKVMSINQIKQLPIGLIAKDSCWLFLWTVQKFLFDTKDILEEWGFNYLATGVWEKTYGKSAGMPLFGFRWNVEFILVGYKNKPDLWPKRRLIPLGFSAPNIRHSQKPDKFYEMIEKLGDARIDIFARRKRSGWDVWGNEVESDIDLFAYGRK